MSRAVSPHNDVLDEIRAAIDAQPDPKRAMATTVACLKEKMPDYTWVGIYLLDGNELVLGPFLGKPSPHTRIPLGLGICGAAATDETTIIVDDVNNDPRYLACSVDTRSEIVVPIMRRRSDGPNEVLGEIDVDSDRLAAFTTADKHLLESVAELLASRWPRA
jgi:GAF domain-containing protein